MFFHPLQDQFLGGRLPLLVQEDPFRGLVMPDQGMPADPEPVLPGEGNNRIRLGKIEPALLRLETVEFHLVFRREA